ncbi:phage-related membrane protein [Yersinia mollaretii]|uniref:DUF2545 family protein n=1 Tax=Yersinia mollaretii TaxID=33060 RepID=UPI0005E0F0B5|nr:DUF2545 family protein [Yersinia mollaretii]CNK70234.1 phage-related membrane protein [Yersinia mollaretii]
MEPLFGFTIFSVVAFVVSVIAGKRSGAGIGFIYFLVMCAAAFGIVVLTTNITNGNGMAAGLAAFISPLIGLIVALSTSTSEKRAVLTGESGEYKKCLFCAESVRKEAIKCKHCSSDLSDSANGN